MRLLALLFSFIVIISPEATAQNFAFPGLESGGDVAPAETGFEINGFTQEANSLAGGGLGGGKKYQIELHTPLPKPGGGGTTELIEADDGMELISQYAGMIYKLAAGIIGVLAVLVVVASGIQMMFGGISGSAVQQAKDNIMTAILSIVLILGAGLILRTVNPGFFGI